jgi:His-Xaa-Ser system radical SAM maturase HxsC
MRKIPARFGPATESLVHRVVQLETLASEWTPESRFVVPVISDEQIGRVEAVRAAGVPNVTWLRGLGFAEGDVIVPNLNRGQGVVLFRESDLHHSLLMTNQCNSYCLMCSQPPTREADAWLIDEALDVIRHIRTAPAVLGLSGGEPLLLGAGLRHILDAIAAQLPGTRVEILTNGRLLADPVSLEAVVRRNEQHVSWLVPLYGHADFLHDFVVQAQGAFEETIAGLLALQEARQPIQLRVVLIEPVLKVLPELCGFIARNLPFVREVALMACEPIGFALANRDQCEVDLLDWTEVLRQAALELSRRNVPFLFMNTPQCALPPTLRPFAHKSISDWKNVFADDCNDCSARGDCSGLFAWHDRGWKPTHIQPILEAI